MSKVLAHDMDTGIHQKRTLAFINHFIIKTIEFVNNFASQCELKLMNYECKLQKIEASLRILETKLSSIPELQVTNNEKTVEISEKNDYKEISVVSSNDNVSNVEETVTRDPRYDKYFKMVQVGVPVEAVKLKILQEGLDPTILEK